MVRKQREKEEQVYEYGGLGLWAGRGRTRFLQERWLDL